MRPIICATEFNDHTATAVRTATALARCWGDSVVLVRSVDEREQFPLAVRERLKHQDAGRLAEEAGRLRGDGFEFEEHVLRGMPEDSIAGYAWKSGARLIVVGCMPASRVEFWALGCLAEEIAATSMVPVLAVRTSAPIEQWLAGERPLNICAAVDPAARPDALLHRLDDLRAIGACTIAAEVVSYPEHPYPLTATPPPDAARAGNTGDPLADEFAARNATIWHEEHRQSAEEALLRRASDLQADLLVVNTHPGTDLTILPHRSLAKGVLRHAPMSILCVPESDIEPPQVPVGAGRSSIAPGTSGGR